MVVLNESRLRLGVILDEVNRRIHEKVAGARSGIGGSWRPTLFRAELQHHLIRMHRYHLGAAVAFRDVSLNDVVEAAPRLRRAPLCETDQLAGKFERQVLPA